MLYRLPLLLTLVLAGSAPSTPEAPGVHPKQVDAIVLGNRIVPSGDTISPELQRFENRLQSIEGISAVHTNRSGRAVFVTTRRKDASGTEQCAAIVWPDWQQPESFTTLKDVNSVWFITNDFALIADSTSLRIVSVRNSLQTYELPEGIKDAWSGGVHVTGDRWVACMDDGYSLGILKEGQALTIDRHAFAKPLRSLTWMCDGKYLLASTESNEILLLDPASSRVLSSVSGIVLWYVKIDESHIFTGGEGGHDRYGVLSIGNDASLAIDTKWQSAYGHDRPVSLSPQGDQVVCFGPSSSLPLPGQLPRIVVRCLDNAVPNPPCPTAKSYALPKHDAYFKSKVQGVGWLAK